MIPIFEQWKTVHFRILLTELTVPILFLILQVKVKVSVTLRLAVYRHSVRLGVKPLKTHDLIFFNLILAVIVIM
jgi:hypothetical protein